MGAAAAVTTVYHIDSNNPTGFAQVLEEGTDTSADGNLQSGEVGKTYTLGPDVISQGNSATTVHHLPVWRKIRFWLLKSNLGLRR